MATAALVQHNLSESGISSDSHSVGAISCDVVIEKLFGIPSDAEACRVVFLCGAAAHVTSYFPVANDGTVDVMQAFPYTPKEKRSFHSWTNCQDCQFKIQIRFKKSTDSLTTKSIGQCDVDLDRYVHSGKGEHLFCLPSDGSSPFESLVMPYIQVKLRPHHTPCSPRHIPAHPRHTSKTSDQLHNIQESIVVNFDADVKQKWKNKDQGRNPSSIGDRRARYAENFSKMNFSSLESYDIIEKRISMETSESLTTLRGDKSSRKLPNGCISESTGEEESVKTSTPIRISAMSISTSTSTGNKDRRAEQSVSREKGSPQIVVREKELEKENRILKASIARLENDLTLSRSETTTANERVSALSNELVTTKMRMEEGPKQGHDKKEPVLGRVGSYNNRGLLRQTSTTSDTIETSSKGSMSRRSSLASTVSRSGSTSLKHETSGIPRLSVPVTDELEAQKLVLAEKLVQKEETIAKLEKQLAKSMGQLRQLEAGIDGVETRFDRELETFKLEVVKKYQAAFQNGQDLCTSNTKNEQGMDQLRREIQKVLSMIHHDIKTLEINIQKQEQQMERLGQEKQLIQRKFEEKVYECEQAEKYISELKDEIERWKSLNAELRDQIHHLEEKVAFMNGRLADLAIDGGEAEGKQTRAEIQVLNDRIASLESGLAEYESQNRHLSDELITVRSKLEQGGDSEEVQAIVKQNVELKKELSDVSEKLSDLEKENNGLREEADQLGTALNRCTSLEEEVQSLQKTNQELEGHLARKKKHIDELQGELKELRLKIQNHHTDLTFDSYASQDTVSSHVDAVLQAEQRYGDLEKILSSVQAERDQLIEEKASKNKMVQSLMKENKSLSASLKKHQKQATQLTTKLDDAKAEITALQGSVHISACKTKSGTVSEAEMEIMQELVQAKVSLAEMDERMIKLRRDHHKSMARNVVLAAKASRLETLLRELKQEKSGILRRSKSKTIRLV